MSQIKTSDVLQRTIDFNYANKKRSNSLKWSIVNGIVLFVFVYDLSCKCAGHTSLLHYVELLLAAAAGANLAQHARHLLPRPKPKAKLDSSVRAASPELLDASASGEALSLSFGWRAAAADRSPPSPAAAPTPRAADEFIADRTALAAYLRREEAREAPAPPDARPWPAAPAPPPVYHLAAGDSDGGAEDSGAGAGPASPHVWRRLQIDPRRLTEFNLNLRLWIHVTILARLAREMDSADAALAAAGLEARVGGAGRERLRRAAGAVPALGALLPFLEPFADQRYAARRLRALAAGGCLSAYRWCAGGADWDESKPTDAELVLHAVAAYLDAQLPPGRPFSAAHLSCAPAPPPRGLGALALHRLSARPPHFALARGDELLEVGAGRANLLHALLLFVAAAAQRRPPALQRLHLGPAGLNMLWIIGR